MPIRTRASCRLGPGFRGAYFSTSEPDLAAQVAAADGLASALLASVLDGGSRPVVRLHEHPATGWGVAVADCASVPAGSVLGLYFGDICREPSSAEYALELPHFWSGDVRLEGNYDTTVNRCIVSRKYIKFMQKCGINQNALKNVCHGLFTLRLIKSCS